jgi:carboxymethylenebutenolidase
MCVECGDDERITRRTFLSGATAAVAGVVLSSEAAGQQSPFQKVLDDPAIIKATVTYKSGTANIEGYLARPKKAGRYRAVFIAHGNPGVPEDIKYTAAYLAQAGFVSLVYDWASSAPMPKDEKALAEWRDYIFRYEFVKRQMQDVQAGIDYLKGQSFVKRNKHVGMVGFCGGGRLALLFPTRSKDVKAVVSFYGAVDYRARKHKTDPAPNVLDVVKQIDVPVQGHYGMLDEVAPAADAKLFEKAMREQKTPVEMYYYEKAGHSFCNFTRPQGSDPGYDYVPEAATVAHTRMVQFLKRHLS